MISLVPREHVPIIWRDVEGYIDAALAMSAGQFDKYDVLQYLMSCEMQLWVQDELKGAAVTQVIPYPRYKAVRVVLLAGNGGLDEWVPAMLMAVEQWARDMGAKRLEEVGRKGWSKVGHRCGWQEAATVMKKDLL